MECWIRWPGLHSHPTSTQLRWFGMSWTAEWRKKETTSAQHMWELLQDCWKSIPHKAVIVNKNLFLTDWMLTKETDNVLNKTPFKMEAGNKSAKIRPKNWRKIFLKKNLLWNGCVRGHGGVSDEMSNTWCCKTVWGLIRRGGAHHYIRGKQDKTQSMIDKGATALMSSSYANELVALKETFASCHESVNNVVGLETCWLL